MLNGSLTRPVLLATSAFPPARGGSSVLLYELTRHFPAGSLVIVHQHFDPLPGMRRLPFETHEVSLAGSARWTDRLFRRAPWAALMLVRRAIYQMVKRYHVERIYAHYPDALFVVAAWQVAQKLSLPLTIYFDILWEESVTGFVQYLARRFEHAIVRYADRRFAITEFAVHYLTEKHGVPWELIPHTIDTQQIVNGLCEVPKRDRPIVHFAGSVYRVMNLDSLDRLVQSISLCRSQPILDMCTRFRFGPTQVPVQYRFLDRESLIVAQRQADILYLPQAFQSPVPQMIRNNMPTKVMEYLVSGRPILVHSPADSYLSWLARKEGFAYVVDQPSHHELATSIDRLLDDHDLQRRLVQRAQEFARSRASERWSAILQQALFETRSVKQHD
jgi:glycosyltransferase involved in cell wall biosynthesis